MESPAARIKEEPKESLGTLQSPTNNRKNGTHNPCSSFPLDYNRLYGDLCKKLLNTPVTEIFSNTSGTPNSSYSHSVISGIPLPQFTTSIIATPERSGQIAFSPIMSPVSPSSTAQTLFASAAQSPFGGFYHSPNILAALNGYPETPVISQPTSKSPLSPGGEFDGVTVEDTWGSMERIAEMHEPIDIQSLVDEFRVTLERYGVSQRFAARFIMQDTSQGNLSFLMEKGRVKLWEELSSRGRIPYIKMKMWLESRDEQMKTLNMLKFSQEAKRNCPKEPFNRRERFSMFQLTVLCRLYEENPNPAMHVRNAIAERLNIPLDRVNVWFQNQRARGFPARRILQQQSGIYSDGAFKSDADVNEVIRMANAQFGQEVKQEKTKMMVNQAPPNMTDYLSQIPFMSPYENTAHAQVNMPAPHLLQTVNGNIFNETRKATDSRNTEVLEGQISPQFSKRKTVSISPKSDDLEQPLDLSTGNSITPRSSFAIAIGATNEGQDGGKGRDSSNAHEIKVTGASRRKRGFKPQQIVHQHALTYGSKSDQTDNDYPKRRKITENGGGNQYDYVLKQEDFVTDEIQGERDSSCFNDSPDLLRRGGNSNEHDKENVTGDETLNNELTKSEPDTLIKAVCTSIVLGKRKCSSGAEGHVLEPELD